MNKLKLEDGSLFYCLDKVSAKHTVKEIFEEGVYSHINYDDELTIFDIGANIGLFTLRIYSFEPVPDIFDVLKKNISRFTNNLSLIHI